MPSEVVVVLAVATLVIVEPGLGGNFLIYLSYMFIVSNHFSHFVCLGRNAEIIMLIRKVREPFLNI